MRESQTLKYTVDLYSNAIGMDINLVKFALYSHWLDHNLYGRIEIIFTFQHMDFEGDLKYLGYNLKLNNYGKED